MAVRTSYEHGTPSWIDLSTTDVDGARPFYTAIFGWAYDVNPTDQGGEYVMARKGGHAVAGLSMQQPEQAASGVPPMWNTYVTVTDVAAAVETATDTGGSVVMPPMRVMDAGAMAIVADPTGAVVCLWQPGEHIGAGVVNEHGALCWNEVMTDDVPTAAAFYSTLFGWGTQEMDMGDQGTYTLFTLGGDDVAGATGLAPVEGAPAHWATVFAVDDCDATLAAVTANGGTAMAGPFDTPVGRIGVCADPQGAVFQIIQLAV